MIARDGIFHASTKKKKKKIESLKSSKQGIIKKMAGIKITTFNIIPLPREGAQDVRPFSETQPPYGQAFLGGRRDRPLPALPAGTRRRGSPFPGP